MAKYLVTGGCGFIGSHLVDSLIMDGHEVVILDDLSTGNITNTLNAVTIGDINDSELVASIMSEVDGCFHLAAIASVEKANQEWVETHQVNATGTIRIFNEARHRKIPIVFASSAAVYGNNIDVPLIEESITNPVNAYGADKLGCEHYARVATLVHGVPTLGFRFFNVYGPRQDSKSPYSGVISIFHDRIINNQDITIFGDGKQTRDFVYVADVVRFLRAGMVNIGKSPMIMNVCTGKATSVKQLAGFLMQLTGNQVNIDYKPARRGDIFTSVGNPCKTEKYLKFNASHSLYEGLGMLLDYDVSDYRQAFVG